MHTRLIVALSLCWLMLWPTVALAEGGEHRPTADQLMPSLMKTDPAPDTINMVWWFPTAFWRAALESNPAMGAAEVDAMLQVLAPYSMFAVVQGNLGPMGAVAYADPAEVRASLQLQVPSGPTLEPLPDDQINGDVRMLTAVMKPMFAQMLGPMGEHMDFYFFDNTARRGFAGLDPRESGRFTIQVGGVGYTWDLPLDVMFAPVPCPKCGRSLAGTWSFCPYDGVSVKD